MAIGDWFLARSEAFRLLMMKFRDHKSDTMDAFSKVKKKHSYYDKRLEEHADKIRQLEEIMEMVRQSMVEERDIKVLKKKKE